MDERGCNIRFFLKDNQIKQLHLHLENQMFPTTASSKGNKFEASQNMHHPIQQPNLPLRFRQTSLQLHMYMHNEHVEQKWTFIYKTSRQDAMHDKDPQHCNSYYTCVSLNTYCYLWITNKTRLPRQEKCPDNWFTEQGINGGYNSYNAYVLAVTGKIYKQRLKLQQNNISIHTNLNTSPITTAHHILRY